MAILTTVALVVQMLSALGVIILVLIQHGKGADMGAAFGAGSSGSLFGASGSANFLSRTTSVLATVFFVCTLALAFLAHARSASSREPASIMEGLAVPAGSASPATIPDPGADSGSTAVPADVPVVVKDAPVQKSDSSLDIPK